MGANQSIDPCGCAFVTHNGWICHGPLCSSSNTLVNLSLVGIIASRRVSEEKCVDSTALQQLCQIDPVLQCPFCRRFIFGVLYLSANCHIFLWQLQCHHSTHLPLAGRQMSYCGHIKGVDQDMLFGITAGSILAIGYIDVSHISNDTFE